MKIGMIGLGRMGGNMAERLMKGGHQVAGYARKKETVDGFIERGGEGAYSLEELTNSLPSPKIVWLMIPAGPPIDKTIEGLLTHLHHATGRST
jgi:6-phosphogluconate dehydrogenase